MVHPGAGASARAEHAPHAWGRLGGFVDGAYAIAATLLVIELRPPADPAGHLGQELRHMWPEYLAYAIGFLQMIAGWLQTRRLDAWMRGIDHYATLLVLFSVGIYALTPFTTAVLATAIGNRTDLSTAVQLSAALLFVALVAFAGLLLYARSAGLLRDDVQPDALIGCTCGWPCSSCRWCRCWCSSWPRSRRGPAWPADRAQSAGVAATGVAPAARRRRARSATSQQPIAPTGTTLISTTR